MEEKLVRLAVFSHKPCWPSDECPSGYATDGGFPLQMGAISELFDETRLVVPCSVRGHRAGEMPLRGRGVSVVPVSPPKGTGLWRKLGFSLWLLRNGPTLLREVRRADAVHTPIPGDIGTLGMLAAFVLRKPLLVRHCGNWFVQKTVPEQFWKWFMERFAGGRNVMLATGGAEEPPSARNPNVSWIFSTSLTEKELEECAVEHKLRDDGIRRLIIVCRQERKKGTGKVIECLPQLFDEFPNLSFDVVGDGGALAEFRQLADSLDISQRVRFHGKQTHEEVLSLLRQADLFCYPTESSEGFPKVVLEALASGLPVITTRVSVLPQLISAGCGTLIDEVTPTAVAQAVRSCLSDSDSYRDMSRCALAVAKQYSLERWRDTIGELLDKAWGPTDRHG